MKLSEKLQNGLLAFSAKIEANKYLGSIKDVYKRQIIGVLYLIINFKISGIICNCSSKG